MQTLWKYQPRTDGSIKNLSSPCLDDAGQELLSSLSDKRGLMNSITSAVVSDRVFQMQLY
eukprot:6338015-Ditylum_brightwellii.AAC.1